MALVAVVVASSRSAVRALVTGGFGVATVAVGNLHSTLVLSMTSVDDANAAMVAAAQQQQQQREGERQGSSAEGSSGAGSDGDPIFQYIVLRRDLQEKEGWPLGALVAQGAHAAVAAIAENWGDEGTQGYVAPGAIDGMHKAVLEVKNLNALTGLSERLQAAGVAHKLWVEKPEDIPTCLATKPARKSLVSAHFKKGCSMCTWHSPKGPAFGK